LGLSFQGLRGWALALGAATAWALLARAVRLMGARAGAACLMAALGGVGGLLLLVRRQRHLQLSGLRLARQQ
jgi:hypothetical protein